jgi:hypothetical protein
MLMFAVVSACQTRPTMIYSYSSFLLSLIAPFLSPLFSCCATAKRSARQEYSRHFKHKQLVPSPEMDKWQRLCAACESGDLTVVERLLQDERVDPAAQDNRSIRMSSYYGNLAVAGQACRSSSS